MLIGFSAFWILLRICRAHAVLPPETLFVSLVVRAPPLEIRTASIYFLNIAYPFLTSSISHELNHLVRLDMLHNI